MTHNDIINTLLSLNLDMEGALRVAASREHPEALARALEAYRSMGPLVDQLQGSQAEHTADEVKLDEALNGEESPMPEPTEAEIPTDGIIIESDEQAEAVAASHTPAAAPAPKPSTVRGDIRKLLTLNDKFLFRRELFDGSDAEMNDTLDLVASMHSLDEAREYLFDDLQWDAENPAVAQFVDIVASYFA